MRRALVGLLRRAPEVLRVRPAVAAALTLALVPLVLMLTFAAPSESWRSQPVWEGSELAAPRAALVFEGDLRSGEGLELLEALSRAVTVERSWSGVSAPDRLMLADGPPRSRQGRAVVRIPPGGHEQLEGLGRTVSAAFPSIRFVETEPWSYSPSPEVLPLRTVRDLPLLPAAVALLLVFYPVLESYSRVRHVLRALFLAVSGVASATVGLLGALLLVGWLTGRGAGHDVTTLAHASFAAGLLAGSFPAFWASRLEAEGSADPEVRGSGLALSLLLPATGLAVAAGLLGALLPSDTVFRAFAGTVAGVGLAVGISVSLSAAILVLVGFRPSGPLRSPSAAAVALLAFAPLLSRLLARRILSAVVATLVAATAALLTPPPAPPTLVLPASVVVEFSPIGDGTLDRASVAGSADRAVQSGAVSHMYIPTAPEGSSYTLLAEMVPFSSVPDRDIPLASASGLRTEVIGGSYLDWEAWRAAFPLAAAAAVVALAVAAGAAASRFYHARFYLARASLVPFVSGLPLLPVLFADASSAMTSRMLALLVPWLLWAVLFAAEVARELDAGADGATAAAASASATLPLLMVPGAVLASFAPTVFLPLLGLLLSLPLVALSVATLVGPRESLRV